MYQLVEGKETLFRASQTESLREPFQLCSAITDIVDYERSLFDVSQPNLQAREASFNESEVFNDMRSFNKRRVEF